MVPTILVSGTWGLNGGGWWSPDSDFCLEAKRQDITLLHCPFIWSTALDGILGKNSEWTHAAGALLAFLAYHKLAQVNVIAHSHGGNVVLYAAAMGLQIPYLVTAGTPVRREIEAIVPLARPHIGYWRHVRAGRRDLMQLLGALFDRRLSLNRDMVYADRNEVEAEETHGGLVDHSLWTARGWWKVPSRA